ncbi:MAG: hypothetical protein ACXVEF_36450 [Polyangiales bacterium]
MAAKKIVRGAALVKKAIEASAGKIESPEPVEAGILKKLRLPNDEKISAGLKTFLAHDGSSLGWSFDDEEPEFEPMALDELVAQEFGDDAVPAFGEAIEMLGEDCVLIEGEGEAKSFLYVGTPDDAGEYPVITLEHAGAAKVSGFVPFDVWIAQRFGALPAELTEEYVALAQALAESNGDGRRAFESQHRDIAAEKEDEDEDEDEEEAAEA